jgi:GTP-binding protein
MRLMDDAAVSYRVVLTKIDKVKPTELTRVANAILSQLKGHAAAYPGLLATSSQTGGGISDLRAEIARVAAIRR